MSTIFTLQCTNGPHSSEIKITIPAVELLFSDTWDASVPAEWDVPGGKVTSLGQPDVFLSNGTGTPHMLHGFSRTTAVGDTGSGTKNALDGTFPAGDFDWECTAKM